MSVRAQRPGCLNGNRRQGGSGLELRPRLPFWLVVLPLLSLVTFLGLSCAPAPTETQARAVTIRGAGATFPAILYEHWFEEYMRLNDDVLITYDVVGSGAGERRFIGKHAELDKEDLVDFGASDAGLTDAQIADVDRGALLVPATGGVLALAYNLPGVEGQLKLPREVYAAIFLGKLTKWNDEAIAAANPGLALPNLTIVPCVRLDSSGTTFAFTNHLSSVSTAWRDRFGPSKLVDWPGAAMKAMGNEGVAGRIKQSVGGIGYVQYGYAQRSGLKMAALENRAGKFIVPNDQSGQATLDNAELPENLRLFFPIPKARIHTRS
jgi:phosphate transport system substrate-binding protein